MQICYNCGNEVADEVLICPQCGALVRRYTTPVQSAQFDEPQTQEASAPSVQSAPNGAVWRDGNGRLHFRGIITGWLVVCLLTALYQSFSYAMVFVAYYNRQFLIQTLQMVPEMEPIIEIFRAMMAVVGEFYAVFVALLAVSAVLFGACIWLLATKKRAAMFVFVGAAAAMAVLQLLFGNTGFAIFAAAMAGVTFALLRRWLSIMK